MRVLLNASAAAKSKCLSMLARNSLITGQAVLEIFDSSYSHQAQLERINRSLIVLFPKKEVARTPEAFRPISLQNCPVKCVSKVLTNRLQPFIPLLVDGDQTSFIRGRNIAENFAYATDLLHCCYNRGVPTIILKLDFHKAFDSVN